MAIRGVFVAICMLLTGVIAGFLAIPIVKDSREKNQIMGTVPSSNAPSFHKLAAEDLPSQGGGGGGGGGRVYIGSVYIYSDVQ